MRRVLVTGATGFVGRQVLPLLVAAGDEVHGVSTSDGIPSLAGVQWHQTDLLEGGSRDLIETVHPSHLLHLAWYAVPGRYPRSPQNLRWVEASLRLIQAFQEGGGERLVGTGTCFEYDLAYGYCSETLTPTSPSTLYGTCKLSLYRILEAYGGQTGLSTAWGRVFYLYGPHEHSGRLVSSVIRSLLGGQPIHPGPGTQVRDFLHVQDVAGALVALLYSDVQGPVNIASGQPVTVRAIITAIAKKTGRHDLVSWGGETRPDDPHLVIGDTLRLRAKVGWTPRFTLDEGLDDSIAWWQTHFPEGE